MRPDDPKTGVKLAYLKAFAPWNIFISTGVFIEDIRADFMAMLWKIIGIVTVLALPVIGLIALVGWGVSASIRGVGTRMQALADGNLAVELPEAERGDEVGQMARAVRIFRDSMAEGERLRADQEDLKARAAEQRILESRLGLLARHLAGGGFGFELRRQAVSGFDHGPQSVDPVLVHALIVEPEGCAGDAADGDRGGEDQAQQLGPNR